MAKNYWMVVMSPKNFEITKERGFDLYGMRRRHRRRAQRMEPDDVILIYVNGIRKWTAITQVTSRYFESDEPIWTAAGTPDRGRGDIFPYRVKTQPSIVLEDGDYIDARVIGPSLEYVRRWVPEQWPLAFIETLHLLPQRDFRLIEAEMKKIVTGRPGRRHRWRGGRSRDRQRPARTAERDRGGHESRDRDAAREGSA
jgi:predicted RNA-binding protein